MLLVVSNAVNIFSDLPNLLLPIWATWRLQMAPKLKAGLVAVFATGLLSSFCPLLFAVSMPLIRRQTYLLEQRFHFKHPPVRLHYTHHLKLRRLLHRWGGWDSQWWFHYEYVTGKVNRKNGTHVQILYCIRYELSKDLCRLCMGI